MHGSRTEVGPAAACTLTPLALMRGRPQPLQDTGAPIAELINQPVGPGYLSVIDDVMSFTGKGGTLVG